MKENIELIEISGRYELDLSAIPAPITDDLTFAIERPKEPDVVEADQETPS